MTILFSDGFEGSTLVPPWEAQAVGSGGTQTRQSTDAYAGSWALEESSGTGNTYLYRYIGTDLPASGVLACRARVKVVARSGGHGLLSLEGNTGPAIRLESATGTNYRLRLLQRNAADYSYSSTFTGPAVGTWHDIELVYDTTISGVRARGTCYIDGTLVGSVDDPTTTAIFTGAAPWGLFLNAVSLNSGSVTVRYDTAELGDARIGAATAPVTSSRSTTWNVASNLSARTATRSTSWNVATNVLVSTVPAMPIISRGVPVYANGSGTVANVSDVDYHTLYRSVTAPATTPQWVAFDLSSRTTAQRTSTVLAWYNDSTGVYLKQGADVVYSQPRDYTIEGNTAAGGGAAPTTGWVNLGVTVTANELHAREHALNLSTYNWVRMRVTAANGASGNDDINVQIDVHDAALGRDDDWLLLGDSITQEGSLHRNIDGSPWTGGPLATLINTSLPTQTPLIIDGGNGGMNMQWAYDNRAALVTPFTGKHVGINYGTNDANQGSALSTATVNTWYANLLALVDYCTGRGHTVVVGKIPWGSANNGMLGTNAATLNAKIDQLYTERPAVKQGPNLYTFFQAHPELLRDGIHPTHDQSNAAHKFEGLVGYEWWNRLWRDALVANVYTTAQTPPELEVGLEVTATRATSWNVLGSQVTASRATTWNVAAAKVTATRSTTWGVRTRVSTFRATTWQVAGRVVTTRATTWQALQRLTATRATSWQVLVRPVATRSTSWNVTVIPPVVQPWMTYDRTLALVPTRLPALTVEPVRVGTLTVAAARTGRLEQVALAAAALTTVPLAEPGLHSTPLEE